MLPELERLIRLQELETAVDRARQAIEGYPAQRDALAARLAAHTDRLEAAEGKLAENRTARRQLEKDLAAAQGRLARFEEQSMAVKTNQEFRAVQSEIAGAKATIERLEERILEGMLDADELAVDIDAAKEALAGERAAVEEELRRLEQERDRHQAQVDRHPGDRATLAADLDPRRLEMFDALLRGRRRVAVGAVRDGRCTTCQVRLRPQLFNEVRLNDTVIRCESCQRILYYRAETRPEAEADTPPPAS